MEVSFLSNKSNYDSTLNLPKTSFKMRADLSKREPVYYKSLIDNDFYGELLNKNKNKPLFILHDGPPYANGEIHLGTALNKILKDFIVKYKNMTGFQAPYVPGWDTHGLPIELKVLKNLKFEGEHDCEALSPLKLRKKCEEYAKSQVEFQKKQFLRLGVVGDFKNSYLTCDRKFEAKQIELFGELVNNNQIYRGLKPVYYCSKCLTALAESEIEYFNDECCSIYVKFKLNDDRGFFSKKGLDKNKIYFLIWTTTAWTLPANVAICLNPKYDYCLVKSCEEFYIIAKELVDSTMDFSKEKDYEILDSFKGSELENLTALNPVSNNISRIILGNHVTLESGTGCVHTAPGHGVEDFEVCKTYEGFEILVVVDKFGKLNEHAGKFCGLTVDEASRKIIEHLNENSGLFAKKVLTHSYPHCWRCKEPVLFRATKQWFCSVKNFQNEAVEALKNVEWIPGWGQNRMKNMILNRSDWCISRQRVWGVPIPAFYCEQCGESVLDGELIKNVAEIFEIYGSNSWFEFETEKFIKGFKCKKCGSGKFRKETDTMDVWFDSGCSQYAVLNSNFGLKFPADLYLEGADQYRGWFQSSLLLAIANGKIPPYRAVCTHGWVVDGQGRKMSKSLSNGVAPEKIVEEYGSEILRLWVASSNYHDDIKISTEILKRLAETYRKIRNTARFMLANISDFDPDVDFVETKNLQNIDKFAILKLNNLIEDVKKAYSEFEFYVAYHAIQNFCIVTMSNFYLDIVKDRLYCDLKDGLSRRSVQTTIFIILNSLVKLIAPIVSFTAEEIWRIMPHKNSDNVKSVFFNSMSEVVNLNLEKDFIENWGFIEKLRNAVQKALEVERSKKAIGSSLESGILIFCENEEVYSLVCRFSLNELKSLFLVSSVEVKRGNEGSYNFENLGIGLSVFKPAGEKCERCWNYDVSVGKNLNFKTICDRCVSVVENFGIKGE